MPIVSCPYILLKIIPFLLFSILIVPLLVLMLKFIKLFWSNFKNLCFFLHAGLLRQPKWGHLKDLHRAIKLCEPALVSADPVVTSIGNYQQVEFNIRFRWEKIYICHLKFVGKQTLFKILYVNLIGSCIQIKIWRLCYIPCKLQSKQICKSVIWEHALQSASLVYQHSSWLQEHSL